MKKSILIILLINGYVLFPQQIANPKIQAKLIIEDSNSTCSSHGEQDSKGFITMYTLWGRNDQHSVGVTKTFDFNFLNKLSEYYWYHKDNPQENISPELYSKLYNDEKNKSLFDNADWVIQISFYPERDKILIDQLNVYCKYILYTKIESKSTTMVNYDVSFHEHYFNTPLDKDTSLEFIKDDLRLKSTKVVFNLAKSSSGKSDQIAIDTGIDLSATPLIAEPLNNYVNESKLGITKLSLSMEYLKTANDGNKILIRKLKYPLNKNNRYTINDKTFRIPINVYSDSISVPFQIYDPGKMDLFSKSEMSKTWRTVYSIIIVPVVVEKDNYSVHLFLIKELGNGYTIIDKNVDLKVGVPSKLELNFGNMLSEELIGGERLKINLREDVFKYVKEYLIFTLEDN